MFLIVFPFIMISILLFVCGELTSFAQTSVVLYTPFQSKRKRQATLVPFPLSSIPPLVREDLCPITQKGEEPKTPQLSPGSCLVTILFFSISEDLCADRLGPASD